MNIFLRVLLFIYAFCLTILSCIVMIMTIWTWLYSAMTSYIGKELLSGVGSRIMLFIIAFIFFVLSMTFLLSGLKTNRDKKAVSKYTNIGEISISLNTIENMALAASRKFNGVRESKAYVVKKEDGVLLTIRATVLPDINIPALSEDIQVKVKRTIEECSGVRVDDVKIVIENITTGYKSRVE